MVNVEIDDRHFLDLGPVVGLQVSRGQCHVINVTESV